MTHVHSFGGPRAMLLKLLANAGKDFREPHDPNIHMPPPDNDVHGVVKQLRVRDALARGSLTRSQGMSAWLER